MSESIIRFGGFRLNPKVPEHKVIAEWLEGLPPGKASDEVIRAILVMLQGIPLLFDEESDRDRLLIDAMLKVPQRRREEWIKDMLYERLTGLDARTGQPIQGQVTIIEKPVITEKVKIVEVPVPYIPQGMTLEPGQPEPAEEHKPDPAHRDLSQNDW